MSEIDKSKPVDERRLVVGCPKPLDCPHCGDIARLHTDGIEPVTYCRSNCPDSELWPRRYRPTPRAAVMAWNTHVREINRLSA